MSTSLPCVSTRLHSALLLGLIDDAAIFPPGLAPLPKAVADHLARLAYRPFIGPLLVTAALAGEVVELAGSRPLRLGLIARPGMPLEPVREGAQALVGTSVTLAGVEVGAAADWAPLAGLGVPLTVEIPREGFEQALDAVAAAYRRHAGEPVVQAKLRTGQTDVWAWPDEAELARFIRACVDRELPFKLTGGLHHAVRADHPDGPQHGLLNVLAAVSAAVEGVGEAELAEILAERSHEPTATVLLGLEPAEVERVRAAFRAYGCCNVLDPVTELADLGLIDKETQ